VDILVSPSRLLIGVIGPEKSSIEEFSLNSKSVGADVGNLLVNVAIGSPRSAITTTNHRGDTGGSLQAALEKNPQFVRPDCVDRNPERFGQKLISSASQLPLREVED
jgi:hypothetical protein